MSSDFRGSSAVMRFFARVVLAAALILLGWLLGGWLLALVGVVLAAPLFVRTQDGRIWWSAILTRLRFRIASARGLTQFADLEGLPGPLAGSTMVREQPFAIIADEQGNHSVLVTFGPEHSQWLDSIAVDDGPDAASITTQRGAALSSGFCVASSASALTRSMLREALPATATLPTAWACLTWHGDGRSLTQLNALMDAFLERHGLHALSGQTVAAVVSTAFAPGREPVRSWEQAGPGDSHEFKNRYQHAGAVSVVWQVTSGAGRVGQVLGDQTSASLERLTAVYAPQPSGDGLRQSVVVTLTCPDEDRLKVAASALRRRAVAAGVGLAPCAAMMSTGFALGLGVGVMEGGR